jgi:hypothetical protein
MGYISYVRADEPVLVLFIVAHEAKLRAGYKKTISKVAKLTMALQ